MKDGFKKQIDEILIKALVSINNATGRFVKSNAGEKVIDYDGNAIILQQKNGIPLIAERRNNKLYMKTAVPITHSNISAQELCSLADKLQYKPDFQPGQRVFDNEEMRAGIIDYIFKDGKHLALKADKEWNEGYMNTDESSEPEEWTANMEQVYEFVPDLVDKRNGLDICYERFILEYPYFCPALNENLYSFEITKKKK